MISQGLIAILAMLIYSPLLAYSQPAGRSLPEKYNTAEWLVLTEYISPIQKKQHEMSLLNSDSIQNIGPNKWKFEIAFLQWDTYANPNQWAFTYENTSDNNWVNCSNHQYGSLYYYSEDDQPVEVIYYATATGEWLVEEELKNGREDDPDRNEIMKISDIKKTKIYNHICKTSIKLR